ncbi:MAG TPA: 2-oxo-4-hydroxy-4-carboxy-5-ureidoimidazoline decarboxylase [Gemmatimonadales bacterium]
MSEFLNSLSPDAARAAFAQCCASDRWVDAMLAARPFASDATLFAFAERAWWALKQNDWLEAFSHHPRIGERDAADAVARAEQSGVATADVSLRRSLADGNRAYEQRFGHVFLIGATGKGAAEMLDELERRMGNDAKAELRIAAAEQAKITRLRLEKLVTA